jgi:GxxExxY protein
MTQLLYAEESYAIMGACFEVYNEKGSGFLEPVYHECLEVEFALKRIPYLHEPSLCLRYKGVSLKHRYSPDFSCWNRIIVELKACAKLGDEHVSQVLNYLNASGYELGLVVNFGHYPKLEYKRIARSLRIADHHSRQFA